jgi:hypothetical protein
MQYGEIQKKLKDAINQFVKNDYFLLEYAVREEAISHRIAVYLESLFTGYHVDCEYDGDLDSETGRKRVKYEDKEAESSVRPDIIIHHRGLNGRDHNQLVIELKKVTGDVNEINKDREKLKYFTSENQHIHFHYCCGALLLFGVKKAAGDVNIEWYKQGELEYKEDL